MLARACVPWTCFSITLMLADRSGGDIEPDSDAAKRLFGMYRHLVSIHAPITDPFLLHVGRIRTEIE